eukprot:SAG31_NODE_3043_length_4753_cov_3.006016_2_plen_101_part_00
MMMMMMMVCYCPFKGSPLPTHFLIPSSISISFNSSASSWLKNSMAASAAEYPLLPVTLCSGSGSGSLSFLFRAAFSSAVAPLNRVSPSPPPFLSLQKGDS